MRTSRRTCLLHMELSGNPRIRARTRRQAMDWSLVLVSQGIESTIEFEESGAGWTLLVTPEDHPRALEAIRLFRLENRRWPWRRPILKETALFDWGGLGWVLLLIFFFWATTKTPDLRVVGRMNSQAVFSGDWWRLFTATWLHADLAHLAMNASLGLVLVGLALGRHGTGCGLLLVCLSGAAGNLFAGLLATTPHLSLGASGMVMGSLGLLAFESFQAGNIPGPRWKAVLGTAAATIMLFVLLGLNPGSDVLAHLGGFLGGLGLGVLASLVPNRASSTSLNAAAGFVFVGLVLWPWFTAVTRPSHAF